MENNKPKIERMWINQPSTLQPLHKYHGKKVLAAMTEEISIRVYPCEGDIIEMTVPKWVLAIGW